MPALLTTTSTMMCPHGGTVIATPGSTRASAGAPVLRASDTFTIMSCPFAPAGVAHPCVSVKWDVTAQRVKHGSDFVLDESSVGLCLAGDKAWQGNVQILATQPKMSGL
jgi:uncharacterized Zn-binding protein involved in type VI secretion